MTRQGSRGDTTRKNDGMGRGSRNAAFKQSDFLLSIPFTAYTVALAFRWKRCLVWAARELGLGCIETEQRLQRRLYIGEFMHIATVILFPGSSAFACPLTYVLISAFAISVERSTSIVRSWGRDWAFLPQKSACTLAFRLLVICMAVDAVAHLTSGSISQS